MEHYAGIDVSLEFSSVCVVDAQGKIVREVKVASEPEALVAFFASLGFAVKRVGLEAGPLSQWLHAVLKRAGFDTLLLETRHVKAALSAMMVKTDRKDARGLGQLIRMGWFRPVHAKSKAAVDVFKPPKNLFQLRYEYLTAQGTGSTPGSIATVTTDQIRLRLDHRIDLSQQSPLVLRGDLRVVAKDPITASNPNGDYLYGLGDTDIQGVYAYNFDSRCAAGFGTSHRPNWRRHPRFGKMAGPTYRRFPL